MKAYTLSCLISPESSLDEISSFREKINALLQKQESILDKTGKTEKIKLAYPIKNKQEGYLLSLDFQTEPEKLEVLKKEIGSENEVLRYLIITKKERKGKTRPVRKKPKIAEAIQTPERKKSIKEKKAEIQDLDKKLEEILGE